MSHPHALLARTADDAGLREGKGDRWTAFIAALANAGLESEDLSWPLPVLPVERLKADSLYFTWAVRLLTRTWIDLSTDYFERSLASSSSSAISAPECYEQWSSAEKALFAVACRIWPLKETFGKLGYDFEFVRVCA